jgi:hypothetical protein
VDGSCVHTGDDQRVVVFGSFCFVCPNREWASEVQSDHREGSRAVVGDFRWQWANDLVLSAFELLYANKAFLGIMLSLPIEPQYDETS